MKQYIVDLKDGERFRDGNRGLTVADLTKQVTLARDEADPLTVLVKHGDGLIAGALPRRGHLCKAVLDGARVGHASWHSIGEADDEGCPSSLRLRVVLVEEGEHFEMPPIRPPRTYQVGLVGESNYQSAIRRCTAGQRVEIVHERGNPYDDLALVVVTERGDTIGYVPRDCWLQGAVHDEGKGCDATIKSVGSGDSGKLGVVLDVCLNTEEVGAREFKRAPVSTHAPSLRQSTKPVAKGWFARLFGA